MKDVIKLAEDYASLQNALVIIHQAVETGEIPTILPMFNDDWNDNEVNAILDLIKEMKK